MDVERWDNEVLHESGLDCELEWGHGNADSLRVILGTEVELCYWLAGKATGSDWSVHWHRRTRVSHCVVCLVGEVGFDVIQVVIGVSMLAFVNWSIQTDSKDLACAKDSKYMDYAVKLWIS